MIAGPDSRAQIAIQAAERLRTLGAGVPWEISPPLPPALIAALSALPGVTPGAAYLALVALAFAGSAALVFLLWRRLTASRPLAAQAAALALLAPSGFLAIWELGEIDRLLFWKMVPLAFLAINGFRLKPVAWRLGLILAVLAAMALTRSSHWRALDLIAIVEWCAVIALCPPWPRPTSRRRWAVVAGAAAFVGVGLVRLQAVQNSGDREPMPTNLAALSGAVGPVSLEAELHPFAKQVHEFVNSELRPRESLLWLQALGASAVVAPQHGKYDRELECIDEKDGWCVFDVASPAPRAVLVSRERFQDLEPIRGLFDVEGLEHYLVWALRPEAVSFEQRGTEIAVRGDAGPDDLVLVRVNAAEWRTTTASFVDPLGNVVLDPRAPGTFEAVLQHQSASGERRVLDSGDYPRIAPEGVVDGQSYQLSPFAPGAFVAIFGDRFRPEATRVLIDEAEARLEYVSSTQINIRLADDQQPGPHALVVDSAGRRTYPYAFEVKAP